MNSINLYVLCQGLSLENIKDYQKVLTNNEIDKKYNESEMKSLSVFVEGLINNGAQISDLDGFFLGFSIPHISKEFDLLKIYDDGHIVNIELKSEMVELEKIRQQLKQNQYYLSHFNKPIYSFTYVCDEKKGIVYSYSEGNLVESNLETIIEIIRDKSSCINESLESFFRAKDFLISPINTPELFFAR